MQKAERGFKVIELGVVVALIAILASVAMPKFIRARMRAREAEVKSNVHAIQIALERYAVDTGGTYPTFLVGGERESNVLRSWLDLRRNGRSRFPVDGMTPFAMVEDESLAVAPGTRLQYAMDPLLHYGYLAEYPVNPFAQGNVKLLLADAEKDGAPGMYPYGGRGGEKMFDLGFGWGDTPQTQFIPDSDESSDEAPGLDAPGCFYYHPIFDDGLPVCAHYAARFAAVVLGQGDRVYVELGTRPQKPIGFTLYGYGSGLDLNSHPRGLDYFQAMPDAGDPPPEAAELEELLDGRVLDSSVRVDGRGRNRLETTGYYDGELDPWVESFIKELDPEKPDLKREDTRSGPDGIGDWVIIEVSFGNSLVVSDVNWRMYGDVKEEAEEEAPVDKELRFDS